MLNPLPLDSKQPAIYTDHSHDLPDDTPVEPPLQVHPFYAALLAKDENYKDIVHKELDLIQAVITRMGANSFQCKAWLVAALAFAFALGKESVFPVAVLGCAITVLIFWLWWLDGFFLYMEQRYRDLYVFTVEKRTAGLWPNEEKNFYDLNFTQTEDKCLIGKGIWKHFATYFRSWFQAVPHSATIIPKAFVGKRGVIITIPHVMFSKTLGFFYFLPLVFSALIIFKGTGNYSFLQVANKKDPTVVQVDSVTLQTFSKGMEAFLKAIEAQHSNAGTSVNPGPVSTQQQQLPDSGEHKPGATKDTGKIGPAGGKQ